MSSFHFTAIIIVMPSEREEREKRRVFFSLRFRCAGSGEEKQKERKTEEESGVSPTSQNGHIELLFLSRRRDRGRGSNRAEGSSPELNAVQP